MSELQHDVSKHLELFNPSEHAHECLHVVGCGAVGCAVAVLASKLGLRTVLQDHDTVEAHNLGNQVAYGHRDAAYSHYKVDALSERLIETGRDPDEVITERFTASSAVRGTMVATPVDTMDARKDIWEAVRVSRAHWLVDTRITARYGVVLGVDLTSSRSVNRYAATLNVSSADVDAVRGVCGRILGLADVAVATAAIATRVTMHHLLYRTERRHRPAPFQVIIDLETFEASVVD